VSSYDETSTTFHELSILLQVPLQPSATPWSRTLLHEAVNTLLTRCTRNSTLKAWTQSLPDWIGAHIRAFAYFGGVPAQVVPENLKGSVRRKLLDRRMPVS
jgi:hypothetical protein